MIQHQPLMGRRVVLTRNREANERFAKPLLDRGAEVLELPLIEVKLLQDASNAAEVFHEMAQYEWLVVTSANGAEGFFRLLLKVFEDIRSIGFLRIAAVGPATAEAVRNYHLKVDLVPSQHTAEALATALEQEQTLDNLRILVITGNRNRDELVKRLEQARAIVDTLQVYQTTQRKLAGDPVATEFRRMGADAIVFASSSAVTAFGEQAEHLTLEGDARRPQLVSIGPSTTATMKAAGIPVAVELAEATPEGLAEALQSLWEH